MSKTEKNAYPGGACIVLRQSEREGRREKISSIVNKISANQFREKGNDEGKEIEIVNRKTGKTLQQGCFLTLTFPRMRPSLVNTSGKGRANAKTLS